MHIYIASILFRVSLQAVHFILLMMRIQLAVSRHAGPRHCFLFVILSDLSTDESHLLSELFSFAAVFDHDDTRRTCMVIATE